MSDWTEERVEQLKKLWLQGWSASQIAKELSGTTRNAVIGKIHRLNLVARQSPKMTPPGAMAGTMSGSLNSSIAAAPIGSKNKNPLSASINVRTPATARSEYQPPAVAFANLQKERSGQPAASQTGGDSEIRRFSQVHNPFAAATSYSNGLAAGLAARASGSNLARQCQWPVGDPRSAGFHFCGCTPADSLPYCAEHARLAYQSSNKSRRVNVGNGDLHATGTPDEREIMVRV